MNVKKFGKLALGFLRHPAYTVQCLGAAKPANDLTQSLRLGADWLLKAQQHAPDGAGYSRRFSLVSGWDRCYIETTGYIIPTLLDVSGQLGDEKYAASAMKAAEWLLTVQTPEGAFTDIDEYQPQVFDTGQVLLGLNRVYRHTRDERYLVALKAAGRWLSDGLDADGPWIRYAYNKRPHAYYTRVAAALIEAGQLANVEEYIAAGVRNLEWAAGQRQPNGYYRYSEFRPGEDALLHTLIYVLEGFSMAFELTGDTRWAEQLMSGVKTIQDKHDEQGLLHSQYDPQWHSTNKEYCVTGLAQYAGVCFDVARLTGDATKHASGARALKALSGWQQKTGEDIAGGLQSSVPLWGYYGGMEFFNWNAKFYLDAIFKHEKNCAMFAITH